MTRALSDFAKIVDVLDKAGASFVSVTQSFNTTTSMGRLTLNVLLSFAQFEREVTGERIRDKIAASKAKGMWMGGPVPLGYDVEERKLVINEAEAATVRMIYTRYLELGSGLALQVELDQRGIRSKSRVYRGGRPYGEQPISRGALYVLLQNRIYVGDMVHKGKAYPGLHEAIIDRGLFDRVEAQLELARVRRQNGSNAREPSVLAGLMRDGHGRVMSPTHAAKQQRIHVRSREGDLDSAAIKRLHDAGTAAVAVLGHATGSEQRALLLSMVMRIDVSAVNLAITIELASLDALIATDHNVVVYQPLPPALVRIGRQAKLLLAGDSASTPADANLVKLLARAFAVRKVILESESLDQAATVLGYGRDYTMAMARVSYLAPGIIKAILEGTQPTKLSSTQLARMPNFPYQWDQQAATLGFV